MPSTMLSSSRVACATFCRGTRGVLGRALLVGVAAAAATSRRHGKRVEWREGGGGNSLTVDRAAGQDALPIEDLRRRNNAAGRRHLDVNY
uniref:Uncharacterized protein n=1 Tax=Pristionchus pacificus TaxID=54126 RepID=A0A2A6CVS1_PRIPA|eukprot:PDM82285.1 hypothetical protein PRIPAC_36678 [Pristionchus pacificus]